MKKIPQGVENEIVQVVERKDTAIAYGSGEVPVFAFNGKKQLLKAFSLFLMKRKLLWVLKLM